MEFLLYAQHNAGCHEAQKKTDKIPAHFKIRHTHETDSIIYTHETDSIIYNCIYADLIKC